jgi:NitT/TauT family transport system substrate-binding protein
MKHVTALAGALLLWPALAAAEIDTVKIPKGAGGVGFLPLIVMEQKGLVEQKAREMGLSLKAEYINFGGPSVVNDLLLAGQAHFAAAGPPAFITMWNRTAANLKVKGVAAMTSIPMYLNSNQPRLKSLKDFTPEDRIAVTAVKVSIPAIIMQMAAIKQYGAAEYTRFDPMTVSLTHPDGVIALLTGKTEITAHFTSPPFHQRERKAPNIHTITTSNEIMGGPSTFTMLYTTTRFHDENPKAYAAVVQALQAAIDLINRDRMAAADLFLTSDEGKRWKAEDLMEILNDPDIRFTTAPENVMKYANFMADVGTIKARPKDWQEMFFPAIHGAPGN